MTLITATCVAESLPTVKVSISSFGVFNRRRMRERFEFMFSTNPSLGPRSVIEVGGSVTGRFSIFRNERQNAEFIPSTNKTVSPSKIFFVASVNDLKISVAGELTALRIPLAVIFSLKSLSGLRTSCATDFLSAMESIKNIAAFVSCLSPRRNSYNLRSSERIFSFIYPMLFLMLKYIFCILKVFIFNV